MRGILRSVTTIDGVHCAAFSRPSSPSRAVSARYPHEETNSAKPVRSFSSSSTISTLSWLIPVVLAASSMGCFCALRHKRRDYNHTRPASFGARSRGHGDFGPMSGGGHVLSCHVSLRQGPDLQRSFPESIRQTMQFLKIGLSL